MEAISRLGYDRALSVAFEGSLLAIKEEPETLLPTTFLSWSLNLVDDGRKLRNKSKRSDYLLLAKFYRHLAHKVYWHQRHKGSIGHISDFMQVVS